MPNPWLCRVGGVRAALEAARARVGISRCGITRRPNPGSAPVLMGGSVDPPFSWEAMMDANRNRVRGPGPIVTTGPPGLVGGQDPTEEAAINALLTDFRRW